MPRPFKSSILTANHLLSGMVVYFTSEGRWETDIAHAEVFTLEENAEAALARANESEVVGAYLTNLSPNSKQPMPEHIREALRVTGPSNFNPNLHDNKRPSHVSV